MKNAEKKRALQSDDPSPVQQLESALEDAADPLGIKLSPGDRQVTVQLPDDTFANRRVAWEGSVLFPLQAPWQTTKGVWKALASLPAAKTDAVQGQKVRAGRELGTASRAVETRRRDQAWMGQAVAMLESGQKFEAIALSIHEQLSGATPLRERWLKGQPGESVPSVNAIKARLQREMKRRG